MTSLVSAVVPSETNMIRLDHTHVLATFHQFRPDASTRVKKGLVNEVCDDERIRESLAEHTEMKRLIWLCGRWSPRPSTTTKPSEPRSRALRCQATRTNCANLQEEGKDGNHGRSNG